MEAAQNISTDLLTISTYTMLASASVIHRFFRSTGPFPRQNCRQEIEFQGMYRLPNEDSKYANRLMSLDVFRGATIATMVLMNNQGGPPTVRFAPLRHAEWHGWTFADLVFPFFLWIVGVSMAFSFAQRIEQHAGRGMLLQHALRRAALIFGLGLLLNGFPHFNIETIRVPGVLQRIAICYLIGAIIFLYASWRAQIYWIIALSMVYWMMMTLIPVPNYGSGVLSPKGNFARYVDHLLLSGHLSDQATDSLGVVGTLPATTNVLFGVLCGQLLGRQEWDAREKTIWMFVAGVALMSLAGLLQHLLPINKKLWTPSYAVLTSGFAFLGFACCYWVIDVLVKKDWCRPLAIYGTNAIVIYAASILLGELMSGSGMKWRLYTRVFSAIAPPGLASLLYALMCVFIMYALARTLCKHGWFLRF
jgi:predicted acyltransferase